MLSDATLQKIQALISKYPKKRSALIPSLQLAQDEVGYLSLDAIREVSQIFELPPNEVYEVASFYTMLYKKPVGRYVIQVCTNISCLLRDSDGIMSHLQAKLGIQPGETTEDKKFTLMEVECLAACGAAPAAQINQDYYENLTQDKLDGILDSLK
jgi:NADH-quinone oxidoreductase E subunit